MTAGEEELRAPDATLSFSPGSHESPLPLRGPISNQSIALARALWHDDHCTDLGLLERIAAGLRAEEPAPHIRLQHEIDVVIAQYRAAQRRAG
ncbi:hypothetical protein [Nocardia sp. NPDC003963]